MATFSFATLDQSISGMYKYNNRRAEISFLEKNSALVSFQEKSHDQNLRSYDHCEGAGSATPIVFYFTPCINPNKVNLSK